MEYMESMMQDEIEGFIALQNAICDDAYDIYKETGIMPLDMKAQRDELLEALKKVQAWSNANPYDIPSDIDFCVSSAISKALGEKK